MKQKLFKYENSTTKVKHLCKHINQNLKKSKYFKSQFKHKRQTADYKKDKEIYINLKD